MSFSIKNAPGVSNVESKLDFRPTEFYTYFDCIEGTNCPDGYPPSLIFYCFFFSSSSSSSISASMQRWVPPPLGPSYPTHLPTTAPAPAPTPTPSPTTTSSSPPTGNVTSGPATTSTNNTVPSPVGSPTPTTTDSSAATEAASYSIVPCFLFVFLIFVGKW